MAWVVNRAYQAHVQSIDWHGRAGSILLEVATRQGGKSSASLYLVGLHGAHGDELQDSLTDAVVLVRRKPRHSQLVVLGDWNVDLLPTLLADPWGSLPRRSDHHKSRRLVLDTFCTSLKLKTVVPARVESCSGGPFGEQSIFTPFTRIPVGESSCLHLPSLLDFFAITQDIILDSWIDWLPAFGDHALVFASVQGNAKSFRPVQGHWRCSDWFASLAWMREHSTVVGSLFDASACNAFFLNAQETLADTRSCGERRRDRIPEHIRSVLARAALSKTEFERQNLKKTAGDMFRAHREQVKVERARYTARSGRVFEKSKKLINIEGVTLANGTVSTHVQDWISSLGRTYSAKWGSRNLQARANILDFIAQTENSNFQISWETVVEGLECIHRVGIRDNFGISGLIIRAFAFGNPGAAVKLFQNLFTSRSFMESFIIAGRVHGKESKTPTADKTRAILPLPAILAVADAIVALKMHDIVNANCPAPIGVMFGARRGTQVLDVAHAAQLHGRRRTGARRYCYLF